VLKVKVTVDVDVDVDVGDNSKLLRVWSKSYFVQSLNTIIKPLSLLELTLSFATNVNAV